MSCIVFGDGLTTFTNDLIFLLNIAKILNRDDKFNQTIINQYCIYWKNVGACVRACVFI